MGEKKLVIPKKLYTAKKLFLPNQNIEHMTSSIFLFFSQHPQKKIVIPKKLDTAKKLFLETFLPNQNIEHMTSSIFFYFFLNTPKKN